jgi:hypothetical protein
MPEPRAQAPDEEGDLGALGAAVHVRLVEHEQELGAVLASQRRVSAKIGRSKGRMSMYSSIE